jgi:hypothetical protein
LKKQTVETEENRAGEGRKSRRTPAQKTEEGRRFFNESFKENKDEEDPFLNRPF